MGAVPPFRAEEQHVGGGIEMPLEMRSPGPAGRRETGAEAKTTQGGVDYAFDLPKSPYAVRRLARRFALNLAFAALVAELAGIGGGR